MLAIVQNNAAEIGPQAFDWWKDWRGEACAIIASGMSAKAAGVDKLRGRLPVIAIKENVDLAPWADVVYGCDTPWWKHRRGLPEYCGLKIGFYPQIAQLFPDVKTIKIKEKSKHPKKSYVDEFLLDEPGLIGSGRNSGFQAFNLAVQFGAKRILLVGYDMTTRPGVHWYGRNSWVGANNPDDNWFRTCVGFMTAAGSVCQKIGVEVVNASPYSEIRCFPKMSIDDTLARWGL